MTRVAWRDIELDEERPEASAEPAAADDAAERADRYGDPANLGGVPRDKRVEVLGAPVEAPQEQDLFESPDGTSRFERFKRELHRNADDVHDLAAEGADTVGGLLARRPPTGQPETRSAKPTFENPQPQAHGTNPGEAVASIVLAGVIVHEGVRWVAEKARRRFQEGRDHARDG